MAGSLHVDVFVVDFARHRAGMDVARHFELGWVCGCSEV